MSSKKRCKWLRAISIVAGCLTGLPVVLISGLLIALTIPSVQQKAASAAARIISDRIGVEVSVGHFSVRPPFDVLLKDVFAGDVQGDTLAFVGCMDVRLRIDALPDSVAVRHLEIDNLTAHTGDLIPSVRIDGKIGRFSAGLKSFCLEEMKFPIEDAVLEDAEVFLGLDSGGENGQESSSDSASAAFAIDIQNIALKNIKFSLEPAGLNLGIGRAGLGALIDVGASCYTVRSLNLADTDFGMGDFVLSGIGLDGNAVADIGNSLVSSDIMSIIIPAMQAEATLRDTRFDLNRMQVSTIVEGSYAGALFSAVADYDIDDEIFKADLDLGQTDIARIFKIPESEIVVAGHVSASGRGINPTDRKMTADLLVNLDSCRYNGLDVSGIRVSASLNKGAVSGTMASPVHYCDSSLTASLSLDSRFVVTDFLSGIPGIGFEAKIRDVDTRLPGDTLKVDELNLDFRTRKDFCEVVANMPGIALSANIPAYAPEIPSLLPSFPEEIKTLGGIDSLIAGIPQFEAELTIGPANPLRSLLQKRGFDLNGLSLALHFAETSGNLKISLETPALDGKYRLPAMNAGLVADLSGSRANATLNFKSEVRNGLMSVKGIDAGVTLSAALSRNGDDLRMDGDLELANLVYDGRNVGHRKVFFNLRPDSSDSGHFVVNANLDDIPVGLAGQFVELPEEIGIQGGIRARATVSGLPDKPVIFAGVKPVGIALEYRPYDALFMLGGQEVTLEGNRINLNGISITGVDSTFATLDGGLDLDKMLLDISVKSDIFEPVKLPEDGPIPVYGKLLTGLNGSITGPMDSLLADIEVSILSGTDITYPIDKKNLAQVKPSGTVKVGFNARTGLNLGGRIDIPEGLIFFSPKLYPLMPFSIDNGSCIRFNGAIDDTELAVSASQKAKSMYKPVGKVSRTVDFITGVKVGGSLKDIRVGFYLDAPQDREIQKELDETSEEDREGLAAVLLATGMYASESNEAAQMEGYALSSIVQSRLNAISSNKLGRWIDLDFGMAKGKHGSGIETTDYTLNVSKSFFRDRLSVKLGGLVSDNAEVNRNSASFINNMSAEYKIDSAGSFRVRLFGLRDYDNIVEGELSKFGIGALYKTTMERMRDSLDRSLNLEVEANLVERSNNQIGPDAAVLLSRNNLFGRNDIFSAKFRGAYYRNLEKKQKEDPERNDTYLFGADFSLSFPYMQLGDRALKYIGQTSYHLGYLKQDISGDYGLNKFYGGVDYSFRQNKYVSHSFSPAYLSIVLADKASWKLTENIKFGDLLKLFADNEFIPSARYEFNYNNYRDKNRQVNTALDIRLKESANLISGIMAACGQDFNERDKKLFGINYDQFVKMQFELRNKFRLGDKLELATRALAGAVVSFGNSVGAPLSEAFSIGGPNSIRAFSPGSIGPGDFHNENYSSQIFHTGDIKMELNAELRFPIFWKINGAVFVDAGNVWNQRNPETYMSAEDIEAILQAFNLTRMYNGHLDAGTFLKQIALGTGVGLRLDYESIVIRLDLGVAIHAPYDTGRTGYYNIPNFWKDGLRLNFGIGYPF